MYCRAQFGRLRAMQDELRQLKLRTNVEIIGVNKFDSANEVEIENTTAGSSLSYLQEVKTNRVITLWGASYRDVRILDSSNRLVGVYNLSLHDLTYGMNYYELLNLLMTAANAGDGDKDGLPDAWEERYLHGLAAGKNDDSDGDGVTNEFELAFGTDPLDPLSTPAVNVRFDSASRFSMSLIRWGGTQFSFTAETSANLLGWTNRSISVTSVGLFDGTGRQKATYSLTRSTSALPTGFIRLNAKPKP
jgi:hypothetical protein